MSLWVLTHLRSGSVRDVLVLSPVLPGLLIIFWTTWIYRDEFIRSRILSAAAVAAGTIAIGSLVYSYLELIGFPKLSMAWVNNTGWVVFDVLMLRLFFQR